MSAVHPTEPSWCEVLFSSSARGLDAPWVSDLDRCLSPNQVSLRRTNSTKEALAVLETGGVDLALLSAESCGSHGLRTLQIIRQFTPSLPCVVVTPDTSALTLHRALELKAYSVFRQPVNTRTLAETLVRILRQGLS